MYSRSVGRPAYQSARPHLHVPPNYSGTMIGAQKNHVYSAEPLSVDADTSPRPASSEPQELLVENADARIPEDAPSPSEEQGSVAVSSLLGKHFPFGHGMGTEELLLIGLIIFLLHEHEGQQDDSDLSMTLWLLGALLFLG